MFTIELENVYIDKLKKIQTAYLWKNSGNKITIDKNDGQFNGYRFAENLVACGVTDLEIKWNDLFTLTICNGEIISTLSY